MLVPKDTAISNHLIICGAIYDALYGPDCAQRDEAAVDFLPVNAH